MARLCEREKLWCTAVCVVSTIACWFYLVSNYPSVIDWKSATQDLIGCGSNESSDIPATPHINESWLMDVIFNDNNTLPVTVQETQTISTQQTPKSSTPSLGYLLAANIKQQMTQAVWGYCDLASLASLLQLSSVQPYVRGTFLQTLPEVGGGRSPPYAMNLSTFYDIGMFRSMLRTCSTNNDHEMVSFETFLERGSRQVVLVYVLSSLGKYKSKFAKGKVVELRKRGKGAPKALTKLNRWATYVSKQKRIQFVEFKASRVLLMDARPKKALHLPALLYALQTVMKKQVGPVTILFDDWRAIHNKPDSNFFYYIPEYRLHCSTIHDVGHGQRVIDASTAFARGMKDTGNRTKVGVHIRGERLLLKYKKGFVKCLNQLDDFLRKISKTKDVQVRVFHDLGKYGTKSCSYGNCKKLRSKFLSEVKKRRYHVAFFDPVKFPSFPRNPAFVSFVEREYLSSMDLLVTVGFGGYQRSIIERFLRQNNHQKDHLHKICI